LIGTLEEICSGEQKLLEFLQYRKDAPPTDLTSLPFLLPVAMKAELNLAKSQLAKACPLVVMSSYEPSYPRKHLTIILAGKWADLLKVRPHLCKIFDDKFMRLSQASYRSFNEFQQFAFHKQLRFCLKVLKRVKAENDHRYLSYWDTTSHVVEEAILNEMLPRASRQKMQVTTYDQQVKQEDYRSLISYMKSFDFEMCVNCLYVISNSQQSFESFTRTLIKEDALKEMDFPNLHHYVQTKMI
jgi:hypothetical protein